ncbi:phosphoribosylglycinamide synthetase C domain-containing protein [Escherichia coli]
MIHGLPLEEVADGKVFHAGTKLADDEQVVTNGGRVLCVTALARVIPWQKRRNALCLNRYPLGRLLLPERYRLACYMRARAELTRQFCQ